MSGPKKQLNRFYLNLKLERKKKTGEMFAGRNRETEKRVQNNQNYIRK